MKKKGTTGIILAGGKSIRMGTNKALLNFQGKPLIEYTLNLLTDVCENIIISANDPMVYSFLKNPVTPDEKKGLGPIGGIYTCLKNSSSSKNFVFACDMPFVTGELIKYLLNYKSKADFIVPSLNGEKVEPLCAVYNKSVYNALKTMIDENNLKMQNLRFYCKTEIIHINKKMNFYHGKLFHNINTKQDLLI